MSSITVYRNDGVQMGEQTSGTLDEIPVGIAVLYADTARSRLYSFFNAKVAKPIQATAAYTYDDVEGAIESYVDAVRDWVRTQHGTIKDGVQTKMTDPHRAFLDLAADPQRLQNIETIRRFFEERTAAPSTAGDIVRRGGWDPLAALSGGRVSSGSADGLDFGVPDYGTAARVFRHLFTELSTFDLTIAVSKVGRSEQFEDVDIVIDVDPAHQGIQAIDGTDAALSEFAAEQTRREFADALSDPVEELHATYTEIKRRDRSKARDILLDTVNDQFPGTEVALRSPWRLLLNYSVIGVIGLLAGLWTGVRYHSPLADAARSIKSKAVADWHAALAAVDSVASVYSLLAVTSLLFLVALLGLGYRSSTPRSGHTSVGEDLRRQAMTVLLLGGLALFVYSVINL